MTTGQRIFERQRLGCQAGSQINLLEDGQNDGVRSHKQMLKAEAEAPRLLSKADYGVNTVHRLYYVWLFYA